MAQQPLPYDKVPVALAKIAAWRAAPSEPVACPVCEAPGLKIARPFGAALCGMVRLDLRCLRP